MAIFFISGVCGVGKTSIIPHLKITLSPSKYQVYDFDTRGVPEKADRKWRISETEYWLGEGIRLASKNINIVVCGFVNPDEFGNLIKNNASNVVFILLDAKPHIIQGRLKGRYTKDNAFDESQKVTGRPVNDFIDSSVQFAGQMRDIFKKHSCLIVDTSTLTPEEVAKNVAGVIIAKTY